MNDSRQPIRPMHLPFLLTAVLAVLLLQGCAAAQAAPRDGRPAPVDVGFPLYLPHVQRPPARVLISAAHVDSTVSGEGDEALQLWNAGATTADLAGWQIDGNGRSASFPMGFTLAPGEMLWCARDASIFQRTFGFTPDCEWSGGGESVPNLEGSAPLLINSGGSIQLLDPFGGVRDAFLYGDATASIAGWQGPAAQLYAPASIPMEGQVWRRKIDPTTGTPRDTDAAGDWSSDRGDLAWGRQVFFPGWRIWQQPVAPAAPVMTEATVTAAAGPDGLYQPLVDQMRDASRSIDLSLYTFEHPDLAAALAAAAERGVTVRLLLEGSPTGGVSDLERWCLAQMAAAGVQIAFMESSDGAPGGLRPRYRFLHAKYGIVDGNSAFVGSENWTYDSMPSNVGTQMPPGRRGVYLFTDAPPIVAALSALFAADWQPQIFADLRPFDPAVDAPPADFAPPSPLTPTLPAPFVHPVTVEAQVRVALSTAPEQAPRPDALLLELLARAGPGDEIHWMQLYEHRHWGESTSHPIADPNPRLASLLDAARRGASVRLLLDSYFDDAGDLRSNRATADYLHAIAAAEGLDLQVRLANPTGRGIHAKLILLRLGGESWSIVGSLNGGEVSHKLNREVTLFVEQAAVYTYLRELFEHDWTWE